MSLLCILGFHSWRDRDYKCSRCGRTRDRGDPAEVLHFAVLANDVKVLERAISRGADPSSALHRAVELARAEVLRCLLSHGVDPNAKDNEGKTPLAKAPDPRHDDVRTLLREHGAHLAPDEASPELLRAAEWGSISRVKWALLDGADVNCRCKWENKTPLHYAAGMPHGPFGGEKSAYIEVIQLLISEGAHVDAKDNWGNTAVRLGVTRPEIVTILLDNGADVNAKNEAGSTPLDKIVEYEETCPHDPTRRREYSEIAAFLRSRGGKRGSDVLAEEVNMLRSRVLDKEKMAALLVARLQNALQKYKTYDDAAQGNADNVRLYHEYTAKRDRVGEEEIRPLGQEVLEVGGRALMEQMCFSYSDLRLQTAVSVWWDGIGGWQH